MKRTRKRILSMTMAAALTLCSLPQNPARNLPLLKPPISAAAEGKVTLNEETGVLTLSGAVTKEQIWGYRKNLNVKSVVAAEDCVLPEDCSNLFLSFFNPQEEKYDYYWTQLIKIDLSKADTSHVKSMKAMFYDCRNLQKLDLSSFDTSNVTDMSEMFCWCTLESLDLSNFDTSKVTNMSLMFYECINLQELDLSSFDISGVTDISEMFAHCLELKTIYASSLWDNQKIMMQFWQEHDGGNTDDLTLFDGCDKLTGGKGTVYDENKISIEYARIDNPPSKPGYLTYKEYSNPSPEDNHVTFDETTGVLTLHGEITTGEVDNFRRNRSVQSIVAEKGTVLPVNCNGLFKGFSAKTIDLSNADSSNVTSMSSMFEGCEQMTELNIKNFDTAKVTNMQKMFYGCNCLTKLDVSEFNTANVTNMRYMFGGCTVLPAIDVSKFNTVNVTDMYGMFCGCDELESLNLSSFHTAKVTTMKWMFASCNKLTELDLSSFDTSNVKNIINMFAFCENLKTIYVSDKWNTSQCSDTDDSGEDKSEGLQDSGYGAFTGCTSLVGGRGTAFDSTHREVIYARIDDPPSAPGYFTSKEVPAVSGKCGYFLNWEYNYETKTLTLSGKSEMFEYKKLEKRTPWYDWQDEVENLVLPYGLTYISIEAFANFDKLKSVTIPATVRSIGVDAFADCEALKDVYVMSPITEIHGDQGTICNNVIFEDNGKGGKDALCMFDGTIHGYWKSGAQNYAQKYKLNFDTIPYETEGKCGDNLTWKFDLETETLTIEGTGDMYEWEANNFYVIYEPLDDDGRYIRDYYYYDTTVPWESLKHIIARIELSEGITSISPYSFCHCRHLKSVVLPKSLSELGAYAFMDTTLQYVAVLNPGMKFHWYSISNNTYSLGPSWMYMPHFSGTICGYADSTAWYYVVDNPASYDGNDGYTIEDNYLGYGATFLPITCTTFDANGGSGEMESMITGYPEENKTIILPECTFTAPKHMVFTGWQVGEETKQPGDKITPTEDLNVKALWDYKFYTVSIDANGGSGEMAAQIVTKDEAFTFPKCKFTAPKDQEFAGWMIGETLYEVGDSVTITEDTAVKAVWTQKPKEDDPYVPCKQRGDLDGSALIDVKDAMLLTRYVNGWEGIEIDLDAADIDGDGEVTVRDAMILSRFVNGWEEYDKYFSEPTE